MTEADRRLPDLAQRRRVAADLAEHDFESMFLDLGFHASAMRVLIGNYCVPDGQLANFMVDPAQPRGIDFVFWLLDDLGPFEDVRQARLERELFSAGVFCQSVVLLDEAMSRRDPAIENQLQWLRHPLVAAANRSLGRVCMNEMGLDHIAATWSAYCGAQAWYAGRHMNRACRYDIPGDLHRLALRSAPLRLPCTIALLAIGRPQMVDAVIRLMDGLQAEHQLWADVSNLRVDLANGIYSLPIVAIMLAAGLPLDGPVDDDAVLGAAVLTGAIGGLARQAKDRLDRLARDAEGLGLPTFATYGRELLQAFGDTAALFDVFGRDGPPVRSRAAAWSTVWPDDDGLEPFSLPAAGTTTQARTMALDYLLHDPLFRESWEVHNWGFMGKPRLTSSVIPSMFIIDNLGMAGVDVAALVATQFDRLAVTRCHYYNEDNGLFPDADLLNGNARLLKYSAQRSVHALVMEPLFVWMERNVRPTGEIPVFFSKDVARDSGRVYAKGIFRCSCTTIVANTISALLETDRERFQPTIDGAVDWLCDALASWGAGSNRFYAVPYWTWITGECLDGYIATGRGNEPLRIKVDTTRRYVQSVAARLAVQGRPTPFQAACRLIAAGPRLDGEACRRLVDIILAEQWSDGGWSSEAFYLIPARGNGVRAHESRILTSSFCYRALIAAQRPQDGT